MNEQALEIVSDKPQELMRRATDVAGICKEIVLKTAVQIQGRKYVKCEGWMSIATAHGCIASSRDVEKIEGGWKAVGEIKRISDGVVLSTAEGFVGMDEVKTWATRPEYACRAMAQTRAISRACRAAFAHVVVLMDAGLSTTPAEEVPEGGFEPHKPQTTIAQHPDKQNAPNPIVARSDASPAPSLATDAHRKRLIELLTPLGIVALEYCQKSGMLLPTETLEDLPLRFVPATKEQKDAFMGCVQSFVDGGEAKKPAYVAETDEIPFDFPPESEPQKALDRLEKKAKEASNEPWRSFPMPFGKQAGVKLEDLAKNYLFGLWANYKVETEYNGKPKKPETIKKDTVFRQMLDDAGVHYKFEKPGDDPDANINRGEHDDRGDN